MKGYPLIKFTLFFIAGIIFQFYFSINHTFLFVLFFVSLFVFAVLFLLKGFLLQKIINLVVVLPIILFGSLMYSFASFSKSHYPFHLPKIKNVNIYGTVSEIELIREKRLTFYLDVDSLRIDSKTHRFSSKIMCNIYDTQTNVNLLLSNLKVGNYAKFTCIISKPKNARNPFEFDYEKYLSDRGISMLATAYKANNIEVIDKSYSWFNNSVFEIRKNLDNKITQLHNETTRGLLRGLILADRSGIDYYTNVDFMNAGVVHVLSVSGLHVGYIVLIFLFLFNRFNIYWRAGLTIICLFVYMVITGSEAPVFRSTVMAAIILAVPFLGRDTNGYNTLSIAALIILLLNPLELFNPSFQLSFSAILALIMLFPIIKNYVDGLNISNLFLKYFLMFLGSTLIAQIGTLPFTLVYFGNISITSLAANFIVIPLSGVIVGLGFVSLALSSVSIWAAEIYSTCNEFLTYLLFYTVKFFGNPDYSIISIRQFTLYDSILFYLTFGILFGLWKYFRGSKAKIAFTALVISLFSVSIRLDNEELLSKNKLNVISIDVGQGDSFLIVFPNGKTALIDAGEATKHFDNGKRVILPLIEKLGIDKIDFAFISHVDSDHYMGILELIKKKKIAVLYKPFLDTTKQNDVDFEKILKRNQIPIKYYADESMSIGNAKMYFLANKKQIIRSANDRSGVIKLVYGKNSILFTGDVGTQVEKDLVMKYGSFLRTDVLKVAHHGSKTSSSWHFLSMVNPDYALISAGIMNKFRHPSNVVLDRLRKLRIKILRTDELGASILSADGTKIEIIDWRKK
ncbi:MAG: competence protein ComEC [Ignavibacteria bacterium]|nr:MAG: competence protein ComEC [Ignavibacteria bacterium]KAF0159713.1 MAG: competence protein ComEC [Ignavibacteria bacterium]